MILKTELIILVDIIPDEQYLSLQRIQKVFDEIDYVDHENAIMDYLMADFTNLLFDDIILTYRKHAIQMISNAGIEIEKSEAGLYDLSIIVDNLISFFNEDNIDLMEEVKNQAEDGQEFICIMLNHLTGKDATYWMKMIYDFNMEDINKIDFREETDIDEDTWKEMEAIRKEAANYMNFIGSASASISMKIIGSREPSEAFGFNLDTVLRNTISLYDGYIYNKDFKTIATDMLLLLKSSSTTDTIPSLVFNDLLSDLDIEFDVIRHITTHMDKVWREYEKTRVS